MMQEKSSNQTSEQRKTTLDSFARYVWRNDDFVAGAGVGIVIVTLFAVIHGVCFTSL